MKINFVMSNNVYSKIFEDIYQYYVKYLKDTNVEIVKSPTPLDGFDIYHYHRPHLEENFKKDGKIFLTVHHDLNDLDKSLNFENILKIYNQADKIICLNNLQKKKLIENNIDKEKLIVIPHGINNNLFQKKKLKNNINNKINLGILSRRYGRRVKGEVELFEIAKRISNKKFKFTLVGQDRMIDKIMLNNLGFEVELFEKLPYVLYNEIYQKIDFLLILSKFEGGPANIPEAIITGTPIISYKIGMIDDFNLNNNVVYLKNEDYNVNSNIIENLFESENFSSIQKNANVDNKYLLTWKDVVFKHLELYKKEI